MEFKADIPNAHTPSSFTTSSEYELSGLGTTELPLAKTLDFYRHRWVSSQICDAEKIPVYYAEISCFAFKRPDIVLHCGSDHSGSVVAAAKIIAWSTRTKLALGDPSSGPESVWWEELKRETFASSAYRWQFPIRANGKGALQTAKRRTFVWKRTHNEKGLTMKWSLENHKLVDEETGEVLAVYAANHFRSWKKVGKLIFRKDLGEDWEALVVLTAAVLLEKHRRRCRQGAGSGGGAC